MPLLTSGDPMFPVDTEIIIKLSPLQDVSRETLEDTAMHVEAILDKHAQTITPGASASACLSENSIEIDAIVESTSPAELHRKISQLMEVLDQHSALTICHEPQNQLAMTSSATSALLVPA
jgi:hypothetical protein